MITSTALAAVWRLPLDVPVEPDAPEGQEWLIDELSKPEYQAAQPTVFDRIAKAIFDWLSQLSFGDVQGPSALVPIVLLALLAAAIVFAIVIFGMPRRGRRSAVTGSIFGEEDDRSAAEMRSAAQSAAVAGDYALAIAELFRAIARDLAEREVLTTFPGTTARDFAARAATPFPTHRDALGAAAVDFDDVRYLGREGTEARYRAMVELDGALRAAKPVRPRIEVPA